MDALAGLCVEDVSWHTPGRNPLSGHYLGREATFDSFAREFELSGDTYQVDVHDVLANDQHTVALLCCTPRRLAQARGSTRTTFSSFTSALGKIAEAWEVWTDQAACDEFWL
jgi:hypothetical protein